MGCFFQVPGRRKPFLHFSISWILPVNGRDVYSSFITSECSICQGYCDSCLHVSLCHLRHPRHQLFFADSLPFIRKEPWLPKSKSFGTIFQEVTGRRFNVHGAFDDYYKGSRLMSWCLAETECDAVRITEALKDLKDKEAISKILMTFKGNLSVSI